MTIQHLTRTAAHTTPVEDGKDRYTSEAGKSGLYDTKGIPAFITETYNLLPSNHFGARPRRSAEQALNVLVEKIYQAWR
jgi:hypothetical protein